jgi:hypothetical protein
MNKLPLLVVLCVCVLFGFAQDHDTTVLQRKNVVKFLPATLPFHSVSFEYERMINNKNSIALQIGLPNQKSIMGKYGIDANSDLKTAEFGTTTIRAAYRHYTGKKKLPKGFYIEPYLKYHHFKANASIEGVNDQQISYAGTSDVKLNSLNMGCQLGVQFLIVKRVTLDLYFLGLEGGFLNGNIITTPTPNDAITLSAIKEVIDQKIADLPSFIGNKLTSTQTENQVIVNANSTPYPMIRGGISIGIAF